MFNFGISRPLVVQQMFAFPLTVPGVVAAGAIPISTTLDKSKLITSFIISNPVGGSSVYLGNLGVLALGAQQGLEIPAGTSPQFKILQEDRQLYELQGLLGEIAKALKCVQPNMEKIPFMVWDLTQLYLFSANVAGSGVTIAAFPAMYL